MPPNLQFRFAYRRFLRSLRREGRITPAEQRKYWLAAVTMEEFDVEGRMAYFIDHLESCCKKIAREAGDLTDDLRGWLSKAYEWLLDNWQVVLQVVLSLLVFLEKPEDE